jgi:hypothetical protein
MERPHNLETLSLASLFGLFFSLREIQGVDDDMHYKPSFVR